MASVLSCLLPLLPLKNGDGLPKVYFVGADQKIPDSLSLHFCRRSKLQRSLGLLFWGPCVSCYCFLFHSFFLFFFFFKEFRDWNYATSSQRISRAAGSHQKLGTRHARILPYTGGRRRFCLQRESIRTPWFWTSSLQNYEKMHLSSFKQPSMW